LREILGLLGRDLHPLCWPPILAGLVPLRRQPAALTALLLAIALLVGHALAYGIPDIQGHLIPAAALLALLAGLGCDALAGFLAARWPRARWIQQVAWMAPALALLPLLAHWAESDRHRHRSADEFGENLLRSLPEQAVFLAEGDNQVFLMAYLTAARGERPDLTIVDRDGNLFDDFYGVREESAQAAFTADFQEQRLAVERVAIPRWLGSDPPRPVFTSGRTNLSDQLPVIQTSSGLVMRLRPQSAAADTAAPAPAVDPWSEVEVAAIRQDAPHGDALTREVAARYWVRRGEGAFEQHDLAAMSAAFDSALAIAPASPDLASYLGAFHAQNGMLADSIPLLQQAVRQNPLSVRGWTNLGLALVKSGRRPEGLAALRESLRIQPEQAWVQSTVRQLERVP
jgi:tetratricopeptide (TPR) repeat protein